MTERLYYHDSYLTTFEAALTAASEDGLRVYLDRTAFYPSSGGQPNDTGRLDGVAVVDVVDEGDLIAHVLERPLGVGPGAAIRGEVDFERRLDHIQQHTGQHLLSAVLMDLFGAQTVSFHMGAESSTIELRVDALDAQQLARAEAQANRLLSENRAVRVTFVDAAGAEGLRKASDRAGTLRIVTIDGCDRSACGGTHARTTGETGCILLRGVERIRGNVRLEFVAGGRAVRRARQDFEALSAAARLFSSALDEVPRAAAIQAERLAESEKLRRKLTVEAAGFRGRELWAGTAPGGNGTRLHVRQAPGLDDELRMEAQSFTAGQRAVFVAYSTAPPSLLVACSKDSGVHAGNVLKPLLTESGGRGGGSDIMAQGSVPRAEDLPGLVEKISTKARC